MNSLWLQVLPLVLSWGAGVGLGVFFFGGLWWSTNQSVWSKQPALWVFGSLMLRMSVALMVFYWVANGHLPRLLACLLGFLLARQWLLRRIGAVSHDQSLLPDRTEPRHAPKS